MSFGKPDAPTPPNPYQTAAAQTGTNVSTGVANAFLNNVNQNTPDGSLRYDVTGNYDWTDPSTGSKYSIPTFTSTQSLSPQAQAIRSQTDAAKMNLAGLANSQSASISNLLNTAFTPGTNAPGAGNAAGIMGVPAAATSYDPGGQIQMGLGDAGAITKSYGPADDFSSDRQRVEDSLMARMNPQLARERGNIEQRLADQGIRYGSQAYTSAMDDYNRQATDTRFGAINQAGQEQQRMMDMAAQRAGFQNAAQMQQYQQNLGSGSFANAAQQQQNAQNAGAASFRNAGLAQQLGQQQSGFNAMNAARNQYLQEQYQQRNQPLNEIGALMGGSQVSNPNWLNSPTSQIPTTDIGGLINQNFAQQSQNYQSANQNWQSTMGGLLGLGGQLGAAKLLSDERTKENIVPMGTVFAAGPDQERKALPISEWSYKGDPERHVGPMAQDVERVDKGAVTTRKGVKYIHPAKVMGSILRAA
jgi:hypothetical protein